MKVDRIRRAVPKSGGGPGREHAEARATGGTHTGSRAARAPPPAAAAAATVPTTYARDRGGQEVYSTPTRAHAQAHKTGGRCAGYRVSTESKAVRCNEHANLAATRGGARVDAPADGQALRPPNLPPTTHTHARDGPVRSNRNLLHCERCPLARRPRCLVVLRVGEPKLTWW